MTVVASISTDLDNKEAFKSQLLEFKQMLIAEGIEPNMSSIFRELISTQVEYDEVGAYVMIRLAKAE